MAIFAQFLAGVDGKRMNTINKFKLNKVFVPKFYELIKSKQYSKALFVKDLTAGVIVGVIAIPLAIAFGIASGVSPQQGLITAIIGGLVISLFGGSHVQIGGPTGAFIVVCQPSCPIRP